MKYYLSNKVTIDNITPELLQWCEDNLKITNPDYNKKEEMGLWKGNTPPYLTLYSRFGNMVELPFGTCQKVYGLFHKEFSVVENYIKPLQHRNYNCNIQLYDYQQKAVDKMVEEKNGILVSPCGSGKTQMALAIIAKVGGRALWVTHTNDLLKQSMDRAMKCFDIPNSEYGTITAGNVEVGNTITFATVQTLSNVNLTELKHMFDIIIVDECHHCVGSPTSMTMFYVVLSMLSARYKIGLTATPYRADGLQNAMFAILGDIIYTVPESAVKSKICPVKVKFINTNFTPDESYVLGGDGMLLYSNLIDNICNDNARNNFIASIINNELENPCLVLSERVDQLKALCKTVNFLGKDGVFLDCSKQTKSAKEERKETLEKLNNGNIEVVFATYKLAKEGLDIPNLKTVVFASPQKDKATIIQSAGRVERKADGKEFGTVIDFVDNFGMLYGYAKKRKGYYKKKNYEIFE